jgi:hypothetical protein
MAAGNSQAAFAPIEWQPASTANNRLAMGQCSSVHLLILVNNQLDLSKIKAHRLQPHAAWGLTLKS